MTYTNMAEDKVPVDVAIKRLVDVSTQNSAKINRLESQIDEICRSFEEYREQNTSFIREEVRNLSERIDAGQAAATTFQRETNGKFEELKNHWDSMYIDMKSDMRDILIKLNQTPGSVPVTLPRMFAEDTKTEEKEDIRGSDTPERHFQFMNVHDNSSRKPTTQMSPYLMQIDTNQRAPIFTAPSFNQVKHSIIVPPPSASPEFHGKPTESPTQFLIRVQEYAESVHAWDRATLVTGISQFLRDSALEWYCQLRASHRRPHTWTEFEDLFLAQFNSPIRKARQEQEWHQCKQKEDETINEFLVRLRALWREQKPKETEADLVKHLFRRMRNDLLTMMGVSRNATLDEVITEVQQIEDILYRRAKGERLGKQLKQTSSSSADVSQNKRYNEEYTYRTTPRKPRDYQVNAITPAYGNNSQSPTTAFPNQTQSTESSYCYKCRRYGHWTRDCFSKYRNYYPARNTTNSKNISGALDERTSQAPM